MGVGFEYAAVGGLLLLALAAAWLLAWRRAGTLRRDLDEALDREQALRRLARLTASDLRGPALSLLSHAEQTPPPHRAALVGLCRHLLDLAENLVEATEQSAAHRLREESVQLGPLLQFVVAQISSSLGPGHRAWRIAPDLDQVALLADRRALHQVLLRVLSSAALATADGDWIDITGASEADGWTLAVADEGTGLALQRTDGAGTDTRGVGVGLYLARSLMQAHGGALAMESAARIGTRACLRFPVARVMAAGV